MLNLLLTMQVQVLLLGRRFEEALICLLALCRFSLIHHLKENQRNCDGVLNHLGLLLF